MSRVIAVTGATGYVGRFVIAELQRRGMQIRALARPESDKNGFQAQIEWVFGNLLADDALVSLVKGCDTIIHLAYEHVPSHYRGGEGANLAGWLDTNVNGSLRLLLAARNAGVERFIFLSSRAVFSKTEPGRELDENHPTSPDTHYGAYKVAIEAFLKSFAQVDGIKTCAIRATGVYGVTYPIEHSKWWAIINAVLDDETVESVGGGTEVHGDDVARVIAELLTYPAVPNDTIHLSDIYASHQDIVRLARQYLGRPAALSAHPTPPLKNVMVCRRIEELGLTLGGIPALESTVEELVRAAIQKRALNSYSNDC